jgi:hypothetical protein
MWEVMSIFIFFLTSVSGQSDFDQSHCPPAGPRLKPEFFLLCMTNPPKLTPGEIKSETMRGANSKTQANTTGPTQVGWFCQNLVESNKELV